MTELLQPGYWALSPDDPAIWCPLGPQACLGGTKLNESIVSCALGFHGSLCGVVENSAVLDPISQSITTCSASSTAVPVILSVAGILLLAYMIIWRRTSVQIEADTDEDDRTARCPPAVVSDDNLLGKVMLLYLSLQIFSTVPAIFEVPFPASSTTFMQFAAAFSLVSPQFFGWQCLSELVPSTSKLNHFELMQLAVALPAAAFLLLTTIVLGMHEALEIEKDKLLSRRLHNSRRRSELQRAIFRQDMFWKRYTRGVTALYLIPLYGILSLTVSTFLCVDLSPHGDHNLVVLYAQPNMSCSGSGYNIARAWAAIALFVYGFVIPLLVVAYIRGWTTLTTCWRWLICSNEAIISDDIDVEEGEVNEENPPPPPDIPSSTLPPDDANLYLFLCTFFIRILFVVILPLVPGIAESVSSYGIVYNQRPTLPRALIAITVLIVFLYSFGKFLMPIDSQHKRMMEITLVQLILLSLAAVVLCLWPSFLESMFFDVVVMLTLLCSLLFVVSQPLLSRLCQILSCLTRKQRDDIDQGANTKQKVNYFAVRRLFMMAHGLLDAEKSFTEDEEAGYRGDNDGEEKATSPYEDWKKNKHALFLIEDTEESNIFTGPSTATAGSTLDMNSSVPPPPPSSSPPPTTDTTAAVSTSGGQKQKRRMRQRPLPFPFGVAGPVIDEEDSSGGSWRWLAADDCDHDNDHHHLYQSDNDEVYERSHSQCYPDYNPAYYYPQRHCFPPPLQQQLPPRSPTRFTPPLHNSNLHCRSPNSYYCGISRSSSHHSSPQTSLSSMSSHLSSCPTCEQRHPRTASSAYIQLDRIYGDYTPRYLNHNHRSHLPSYQQQPRTKKASHVHKSTHSSKGSSSKGSHRRNRNNSRSLIELSSDSDEKELTRLDAKDVADDGFCYDDDAFDLAALKARTDDGVALKKKHEAEDIAVAEVDTEEDEEEDIIKQPWWHPVFLADSY